MNVRGLAAFAAITITGLPASAHVAEQGFVLLLPTNAYIAAGAATVALTVALMAAIPAIGMRTVFGVIPVRAGLPERLRGAVLFLSFLAFCGVVAQGWIGSRDPLRNALPLGFWTVLWIGLVSVQGLFFDIWRWLNPLAWPAAVLARARLIPPVRLPRGLGRWPACLGFLAFGAFLLADPAPADPWRLASVIAGYFGSTMIGVVLFGKRWLLVGEFFTVLMRIYGQISPLRARAGLGLWGWRAVRLGVPSLSLAVFMLLLLGTGSFDGLNETFYWLGILGVNPLEFPGRSAVIAPTLIGLFALNAGLIAAYAGCIWLGVRLAGPGASVGQAFRIFAPSLLPIALAYHVSHYLTSFLVDIQYVRALAAPEIHVTTGFFNTLATVRVIWLTQAGFVVVGHVLAILLAHALALKLYAERRAAVLSQAPLAVAMIAYTIFGLWLLAAPRGA